MANKPKAGSEDKFGKALERSKKISGDVEDEEDDDEDEPKEKKSKSKSSGGRKKKSAAEYREDDRESGKLTRGRPGTGDFQGRRDKPTARARPKMQSAPRKLEEAPAGPPLLAPTPVRNPARLANKVMNEQPMGAGGGGFLGIPFQPPEGQRGMDFLRGIFGGGAAPEAPIGTSRVPPTGLPPLTLPGGIPRPGGVNVQGAEAALPPPTKVRTTSIPPASDESKPKKKLKPKIEKEERKEEKKKSTRDRLADKMSEEDRGGERDYYEQLKRGRFRLG